jgi:YjbR
MIPHGACPSARRPRSVRSMSEPGDVAPDVLARLRPICLGLPETYEEPAWVGIRWRIRTRTFAHVLTIDPERQVVFARAVMTDQPACVLTFRASGDELHALTSGGYPFYKGSWGRDVVVMVIDADVDWAEVAELLTESYRILAPKRLAASLRDPPATA